jgi:hypothetical protein
VMQRTLRHGILMQELLCALLPAVHGRSRFVRMQPGGRRQRMFWMTSLIRPARAA